MGQTIATYATALTLAVLGIVGFVDSVLDDRAGPAALFAIMTLGVLALARTRAAHTAVPLRRDLASWLERTSFATGESVEEMSNRAISRLRAGFVPFDRVPEATADPEPRADAGTADPQ